MEFIIEKKQKKVTSQDIKIISWNLDIENVNISCKIHELLLKDADIIMLQECAENIDEYFYNYISYKYISSHCGFINLLIHKRMKPILLNEFIDNGIIIYHIDTKIGQMVVGSIHLQPYSSINDKILRTISIYKVLNFLNEEQLTKLPIIIGGDTNMRDDEQICELTNNALDDVYNLHNDENKYHTWPNKTSSYKDKFSNYKNFRFDRFFYSNLTSKTFNTIVSDYSDHLIIETNINFKRIIHNSINTELEKIKLKTKKYYNEQILLI
jgi:hypothetical protein